jgi:hypothetical protein
MPLTVSSAPFISPLSLIFNIINIQGMNTSNLGQWQALDIVGGQGTSIFR